jgi:opacity protein-like surface antigen
MKRILLSTTLLAALIVPSFAGTDTAPMQTDSKDMKGSKDMKQMSTEQSDAGFYVAGYGGAQFDTAYGDNRQTLSVGGFGNDSTNSDIHSRWGGVGGIKAGYNFQSFPVGNFMGLRLQPAVEAEGMYIGMDDSHAAGSFGPGVNTRFSSNAGDFFLNGILRFKNNSIVTPYVGVGAGLEYYTTHTTLDFDGGSVTGLDTSDLDFAAQGLFGLDVQICKHISLFSEYKFVDAIGNDGKNSSFPAGPFNATYRFKPDQIQQNLITAGVKYTF